MSVSPKTVFSSEQRVDLAKIIRHNQKVLKKILLPTYGFLNEEHWEATHHLIKAAELFDKLAE